jgi:hypothetical protein
VRGKAAVIKTPDRSDRNNLERSMGRWVMVMSAKRCPFEAGLRP